MPEDSPWYTVVTGDELQQGDLISGCQVLLPQENLILASENVEITADTLTYDVVVLTQSCDLEQEKIEYVVVCPHWDLAEAKRNNEALEKTGILDSIRKRQMPRYAMLAPENSLQVKIGVRLVDFGQVFSVPRGYLASLANKSGNRLRLLPPYREFIAQSFASFFMRVGFPRDIKRSELE